MSSDTKGRSRLPLLLLVLLFGLPPAAGWIYLMNPEWLPEKQKNHGTLVSPPRPLQALVLQDDRQQPFDWSRLSGQWVLISRNSGTCGSECQQQLHELSQVRRAVGAERRRVARMLILESPHAAVRDAELERLTEGARVLYLAPDQQQRFEQLFAVTGTGRGNAVYLADPNGMLMMGYSAGTPPKNILKDLETLLKASRNWTTGVNNGHG